MIEPFKPPAPAAVWLDGPVGQIEARVDDGTAGLAPPAVGVICHPHPLHGGTMQNKVVHTLARSMQELGTPTVRFNFRGVGASAGSYDGGAGEVDDALAVIAWARSRWQCERLWLGGFSFGAAVALLAADAAAPDQLVTVAPPVPRMQLSLLRRPRSRWLIIQGDRDELVSIDAVRAWAGRFEPPPQMLVLEGAEHFFHGRLTELREGAVAFLARGGVAGT